MTLTKKPFELGKGEKASYQYFLPFPQCFLHSQTQISICHLRIFQCKLVYNLYILQTTISNLMKMQKVLQKGGKHKEKELLIASNSSFSHSVFKRLVLQTHKNKGLFGKGLMMCMDHFKISLFGKELTHSHTITPFDAPRKQAF